MSSVRRLVGFVVAVLLVAFALPASAGPEKIFSITAVSTPVPGSFTTVQVNVTIKNEVPNGNSSFNSLKMFMTAPSGVTIASATSTNGAASVVGGTSVAIPNMSPVKPQKAVVLTLVLSGVDCTQPFNVTFFADQGGAWTVWTGSSFSGDTFAAVNAYPFVLSVPKGCTGALSCNAFGTPFVLGDEFVAGLRGRWNKDGSPCVTVTYEFTNYMQLGENKVSVKWDTGVQPFAAFMYSISWNPIALTPGELGWPSKRPKVAWKEVGGTPEWTPALACVGEPYPVPYGTLTNLLDSSTPNASSTFDVTTTGSLPLPGTTIVVDGERMLVTGVSGSAVTALRGQEGTGAVAHVSGTFVTGTPVLLPAPLVKLAANITNADTSIPVSALPALDFPATVPPPVPFPAVINQERILVTDTTTTPGFWTAVRGQGGTTAVEHTTTTPQPPLAPFVTYVMSTPLPIVPSPAPAGFPAAYGGKVAPMCVAEHGFVPAGMNSSGVTLIQYYTTIIDMLDGYVGIE
jgi:hypothetical protein